MVLESTHSSIDKQKRHKGRASFRLKTKTLHILDGYQVTILQIQNSVMFDHNISVPCG